MYNYIPVQYDRATRALALRRKIWYVEGIRGDLDLSNRK